MRWYWLHWIDYLCYWRCTQSEYYSQCIPSSNPTTAPSNAPTTKPSTPSSAPPSSSSPPSSGGSKSPGCGKAAGISSGTFSITVNGKNRQYIVRVPQNYNPSNGYKLIFALHWLGGNMQAAQSIEGGYYGLQALAKELAIFVAPDDILLMDAILGKINNNLCVDTTQVFATGFSYGAGMSYAIACARPDKFRAVALYAGVGIPTARLKNRSAWFHIFEIGFEPNRAEPSRGDPYAGAQLSGCAGGTKPIAFWSTHGIYDSVLPIANGRALRDHFLQVNGCQAKNAPEHTSGQPHTKTVYTCNADYPVWYYGHNGGHVADPQDPGQSTSWAPAEVWSFFSQFS
ncbi:unnamed protein product [Aphanomyces euteiches]|uniref:Peptidase S9 prolyl oligopeptidase catalytic domain-containing protein n=1 Tax=Aphanomyces euteiches TaxID=100861 RepID=A0A6G0WDZ2_9STRA|nr:hypothetical protein Ae201684_016295 [Aphanomyces euteiches]KAH9154253.1 hypothetical protein AeRB84_003618 [Aphanomyces euteiches]